MKFANLKFSPKVWHKDEFDEGRNDVRFITCRRASERASERERERERERKRSPWKSAFRNCKDSC